MLKIKFWRFDSIFSCFKSEREIESLKYKIADYEKTIKKFRDLVQQLQTEKDDLNRKSQARIDELQVKINQLVVSNATTSSPGTFDFKQKLVESKNFAKVSRCHFRINMHLIWNK